MAMCIYSMPTQRHSRPLDNASDMVTAPTLGVCYYPEHWPEDQWQSDAENMVAAGLSWVRIAEFAWSRIEPSPGEFDWGWLDRAVDILGSGLMGRRANLARAAIIVLPMKDTGGQARGYHA